MVNSANTSEVMVESVLDSHPETSSVPPHSGSLIVSFRNAGCRLKLNRGQGRAADSQIL